MLLDREPSQLQNVDCSQVNCSAVNRGVQLGEEAMLNNQQLTMSISSSSKQFSNVRNTVPTSQILTLASMCCLILICMHMHLLIPDIVTCHP